MEVIYQSKLQLLEDNKKMSIKMEKMEKKQGKMKKKLKENSGARVSQLLKENEAKNQEMRLLKELLKSNDLQFKFQESHFKNLENRVGGKIGAVTSRAKRIDDDARSEIHDIKDAVSNNYLMVSEITKDGSKILSKRIKEYSQRTPQSLKVKKKRTKSKNPSNTFKLENESLHLPSIASGGPESDTAHSFSTNRADNKNYRSVSSLPSYKAIKNK